MIRFSRTLDVYHAFNFKKDKQSHIGVVLSMKVGGKELKADLESIKNPEQPTKDLKVVAVLSKFNWDTGITDPIQLLGQLSLQNRQTLAMLLLGDLTNTEVVFSFAVYQYDAQDKTYFKSCFHKDKLAGVVAKDNEVLTLRVSDDASELVSSPPNFTFQLAVKPQPKPQQVTIASAPQMKVEKKWGSKNG
ncbi:hypothetical protein LXT21_39105 [Myxococcus sp. K38C18041901]|uniref:hypothetical protein n=1 Tax=Myxococcus guangdongensis TaxID=2906760 RepID=UPI0020A7AF07|nr:hypothetical protein [Myxococcus guangdongensis]MCP3064798.1 hypothetical protein [Myxococcus guangdongensis]